MSENAKLKVMAFGGVEDLTRNCYVIEYGRDILIVDLGLSFPDYMMPGIDYLIPDVNYLKQNKDRIVGIVISHSHLDHVGAIPHVIEELGFPPIYCRNFTFEFVKEKLKEYKLDKRVTFKQIEVNTSCKVGRFEIRLISVTHSIPEASAVYVKTPGGNVIYTGDYKFEENPITGNNTDEEQLMQASREGIDLALMDSTGVFNEHESASEEDVAKVLERLIKFSRSRVLVATFSSSGPRLYSLIEIAKKLNKKVVITGRSLRTNIDIMRKLKYIICSDDLFVLDKNIGNYDPSELLILATGTQGEEMSALARISRVVHPSIKLNTDDTVILSSSVIPGNNEPIQRLIDSLLKIGARVFHQSFIDVHSHGHGSQDHMKKMYEILKPRYVMPVHGWPSFIHEFEHLLKKWGHDPKKILISDSARIFTLDNLGELWKKGDKIKYNDVYIDGGRVLANAESVINDRVNLSQSGIIVLFLETGNNFRKLNKVRLTSRGFIDEKSNVKYINDLKDLVRRSFNNFIQNQEERPDKKEFFNKIKRKISRDLIKSILDRTQRRKNPVVLVDIE
ncbi:ribonuclease J [Candidatus Dojkabacteria bacterium]|nr:ribonuclease J [Candidatus Dojkabacteria bacterium]